jgi:hypothetical protein
MKRVMGCELITQPPRIQLELRRMKSCAAARSPQTILGQMIAHVGEPMIPAAQILAAVESIADEQRPAGKGRGRQGHAYSRHHSGATRRFASTPLILSFTIAITVARSGSMHRQHA